MQMIDPITGEVIETAEDAPYGVMLKPEEIAADSLHNVPEYGDVYGGNNFGDIRETMKQFLADSIAIEGARQEAASVEGVREKLADAARLRARYDELKRQRDNAILDLLTPEQRATLEKTHADLDAIIVPLGHVVAERIEEVKDECLALGRSVSGDGARVVYNSGRTSWDAKGLEIYSRKHPDVMKYKKMSNPYASLTLDKTE